MTLYQLIESALVCQQARADGSFIPLLARSRRAPMRSAVKRYASILGVDAAKADADAYHRPDHEIRSLIEANAPKTLAINTVRNLSNDVVWLLRTAVEQGWLEPLPPPLLSWRERRGYPGSFVKRGERPHRMTRYRLDLDQCPPALRDELTAYIK